MFLVGPLHFIDFPCDTFTVQTIHNITLISQEMNQTEVMQIYIFQIRKLIQENEFVILN